jgi:uncharacterized protein
MRVLSIDGGGVRGYLAALLLEQIERVLDQQSSHPLPVGRRFDLIAGTSVGGLIAMWLALGRKASDLVPIFESKIPTVFGPEHRRSRWKRLVRPLYRSNGLRQLLTDMFADTTLADLRTGMLVPCVALGTGLPRIYKTGYLGRNEERLTERLVDVGLATCAAPTYFQSHSPKHSSDLIDGGLCANNPAMLAILDGLEVVRPPAKDEGLLANPNGYAVKALSVGTGQPRLLPYVSDDARGMYALFGVSAHIDNMRNGGMLNWAKPVAEIFVATQSAMVHYQARTLLGPRNYLRINPVLNTHVELDDGPSIGLLREVAKISDEERAALLRHFV